MNSVISENLSEKWHNVSKNGVTRTQNLLENWILDYI